MKKGSIDYFFGLGRQSLSFSDLDENSGELKEKIKESGIPFVETGVRYGVSQSFDVGVKYTFKNQISVDGKYLLFGNDTNRYAMASGAGVSLGKYSLKIRHYRQILSFFDLYIPWYHSFDLTNEISFVFKLYLLKRWVDLEKLYEKKKENFDLFGLSFGFNYRWLIMEVSFNYEMRYRNKFFKNFIIGYRYGWADVNKPTF